MESLFRFLTPPHQCSYLPEQSAQLEYEIVRKVSRSEYFERMKTGWRRFGFAMFRPQCANCRACQAIRVPVAAFRPNRSQKRAVRANSDLRLEIGEPVLTSEKLELYDRFHAYRIATVGWSDHGPKDPDSYRESFIDQPFRTEEWCYRLGDQLVGCGYVDALSKGLSAIYFFYEPELRDRSLGTFNVMQVIAAARQRRIPHVYLGYYVAGCRSLEYKANFQPNEVLSADGNWLAFRE